MDYLVIVLYSAGLGICLCILTLGMLYMHEHGDQSSQVDKTTSSELDEISEITKGLLITSNASAAHEKKMRQEKTTHILSVIGEPPAKISNINYLCLSLPRSGSIAKFFDECSKFIHTALAEGGTVVVHCVGGQSRSVSVVLAYLIVYRDMSLEKALESIRTARRCIDPHRDFLQELQNLEKAR